MTNDINEEISQLTAEALEGLLKEKEAAIEKLKQEPITVYLEDTQLLTVKKEEKVRLVEEIKAVRRAIFRAQGKPIPPELREPVPHRGC